MGRGGERRRGKKGKGREGKQVEAVEWKGLAAAGGE